MIEFTCNPFLHTRDEYIPKPPATNFIDEHRHMRAIPNICQPPMVQETLMPPVPSAYLMDSHYSYPQKPKENSKDWLWLILFVLLGGFIYVLYKDEIDSFFRKLWSRINL
jgi:hypothetical protein